MTSDIQNRLRRSLSSTKQQSEIPKIGISCEASQHLVPWSQTRKLKKYELQNGNWILTEISDQVRAGESRRLAPAWSWPLVTLDSRDTAGKIVWTSGWLSGTPRRLVL